nr:uncharacterized protein LOC126522305 isoform X6 [Dermacentor andersoni]XP_054926596.1 uncharacterized protein LOC126530503 isoform X10 [Dermacentor andersoni]XP_054931017.1 uncharacterized protein LOC126538775 isoform X6 [Dermacentor andersoni]
MSTDADQIFSDRTVSSSGLKWDASPSLVRKCLQNLPGLLRPSRASEKSLRYWREQTGFTELCFMSRWADTMSPDAVTLWFDWHFTTFRISPHMGSA